MKCIRALLPLKKWLETGWFKMTKLFFRQFCKWKPRAVSWKWQCKSHTFRVSWGKSILPFELVSGWRLVLGLPLFSYSTSLSLYTQVRPHVRFSAICIVKSLYLSYKQLIQAGEKICGWSAGEEWIGYLIGRCNHYYRMVIHSMYNMEASYVLISDKPVIWCEW